MVSQWSKMVPKSSRHGPEMTPKWAPASELSKAAALALPSLRQLLGRPEPEETAQALPEPLQGALRAWDRGVYVYIHIYIYISIYLSTYVQYMCICMYVCMYVRMCVCMYVLHIYVYVCMCTCICICIGMCICICCLYLCTCMHGCTLQSSAHPFT